MPSDSHTARLLTALGLASCLVATGACGDDTPDATPGSPDAPTVNSIDARPGSTIDATSGQAVDAAPGTPDGAVASGFSCTSGILFAGNPLFEDPMMRPPDGTLITADPPFPYRMIVFTNGEMITHDGQEIWHASLSDGKLHKLAGTNSENQALTTGACSVARFANIFGIALGPDGSLFVSDQTANTVLKITDPLSAGCTVSHYAGTPTDVAEGDISPDDPPNLGNVDGAGAIAKFNLIERPAVDASGNVYVWDNGNDSIRMIASDADHTVSTIATNVTDGAGALVTPITLGGKVYIYGLTDTDVFLTSIDPVSKAKHDLFRGGATLFGGSSGESNSAGGIVTDGVGLIVHYNGQLFYVTTAGTISPPLAGVYGIGLDFVDDYDVKAAHPAADVQLVMRSSFTGTSGAEGFLAIDAAGNLYVTALVLDNYVEEVACTK